MIGRSVRRFVVLGGCGAVSLVGCTKHEAAPTIVTGAHVEAPASMREPDAGPPLAALSSPTTVLTGGSQRRCTVACGATNGQRMRAADEARVATALAPIYAQMQSCPAGSPPPPVVLRFDSSSSLTSLGVDAGGVGAGGCIGAFRETALDVKVEGPIVVRCTATCVP